MSILVLSEHCRIIIENAVIYNSPSVSWSHPVGREHAGGIIRSIVLSLFHWLAVIFYIV